MTEETLNKALLISNRISEIRAMLSALEDYKFNIDGSVEVGVHLSAKYDGYYPREISLLRCNSRNLDTETDKTVSKCTLKYFKELETELKELKAKYEEEFKNLN